MGSALAGPHRYNRADVRRAALGLVAAALAVGTAHAASAQGERVVDVVDLQGVIDPTTAGYLSTRIEDAAASGAHAVVVQLDTPGGLSVAMEDMVQEIVRSSVPVVVWVGPPGARAASAGVFLVYASHVAAMAEATHLGAAHPVDLGGEEAGEKVVNDAVARLRGLAERRDRDSEFAEAAVRESESLTATEAEERGVVEIIANSIPELLGELDGRTVQTAAGSVRLDTEGRGVTVRFHEPGLLTRILHAITDPTVAYLLLILGFWAIVFEISQPGLGIAGFAGAVALILAFYALAVLPVNIAGLLLLLLGLALFTLDVLTAGLGVFTVGGALALAVGSVLLFAGVDPSIRVSPWLIGGVVIASVLFFGFAMTVAMRARRRPASTGGEGMIGLLGESRADLAPEGQIWVKGALWRARALNGHIPKGRPVRVRRVDGLLLIVQEERPRTEGEGSGPEGKGGS
jgi:membrane-bound serine protease (ClpP class)